MMHYYVSIDSYLHLCLDGLIIYQKNSNKNTYISIENSSMVKSACISVMFLISEKKYLRKPRKMVYLMAANVSKFV